MGFIMVCIIDCRQTSSYLFTHTVLVSLGYFSCHCVATCSCLSLTGEASIFIKGLAFLDTMHKRFRLLWDWYVTGSYQSLKAAVIGYGVAQQSLP